MSEPNVQLLSFQEDEFDLERHKSAADAHAREISRERRTRRQISVYKIIIMLLSFVIMFALYYFINDVILQYDFNRHQNTEYIG
jgi:hypothetical protein